MPYAILRFEKRKGGPAGAIERHHECQKERYGSNPDIDHERSHYRLIQPKMQYYAEIQRRIEKAQRENPQCKVRKDGVKFIDTIVTATPSFLEELSEERRRRYFEWALEFLKQEIGEDNIFSAVIHMDERNPHMHLCFVPLTRDKRLSAKEVMGGRDKLVEWQDKFHDHMAAEFPGLERGQAAAVTNYYGTNLISKESLAEHLASHAGQDISVKSEIYRALLDEMWAEQQNNGMTFDVMSL